MYKKRRVNFFMTSSDELFFSREIHKIVDNIKFFASRVHNHKIHVPDYMFDTLGECKTEYITIVNLDLVENIENYVEYGGYYHYGGVGRGQIQFVRYNCTDKCPQFLTQFNRNNPPKIIRMGDMTDTYLKDDIEDKQWKNKVFNLLKKHGSRLNGVYACGNGGFIIRDFLAPNIFALPDALKTYNGRNRHIMVDTDAREAYVAPDVTLQDLAWINPNYQPSQRSLCR